MLYVIIIVCIKFHYVILLYYTLVIYIIHIYIFPLIILTQWGRANFTNVKIENQRSYMIAKPPS